MLVQPSRTATVCEVDRARKRAASCNRVQNLGYRINKYWRSVRSETTLLTPNSSCEACSAFTRVAACTLARSPYFVTRYPRASNISSPPCLPRLLPAGAVAGWDLHPLESAAFSRRTPLADIEAGRSLARSLIDTFAGIQPAVVPEFVLAQLTVFSAWLFELLPRSTCSA